MKLFSNFKNSVAGKMADQYKGIPTPHKILFHFLPTKK